MAPKKRFKLHILDLDNPRYRKDMTMPDEKECHQAFVACSRLGADQKALAKLFRVSKDVIRKWMKRSPSFRENVLKGKEIFDTSRVERALCQRAIGFEYDEVTTEEVTLKSSKKTGQIGIPAVKKRTTRKLYPAETSAMFFWLINRQPERWRNIKHVEFRGRVQDDTLARRINVDRLKQMRPEEVEALADLAGKCFVPLSEEEKTNQILAKDRIPPKSQMH